MSFEGVWRSRGYGWVLKIDSAGYALHDVTASACVEFERGTPDEFEGGFEILAVDGDDRLSLRVRNDITRYDFERLSALPAAVLPMEMPRIVDPCKNLDFFCDAFAQDYAFFDLRGLDWGRACSQARKKIDSGSSADELFAALHALIAPLKDNHVVLTDGVRTVNSEKIAKVKALLRSALGLQDATVGIPDSIRLLSSYLNTMFLRGRGNVAANGAAIWGMIAPGIGYLNVLRFFGLADSDIARAAGDLPPRRPDHAAFQRQDLDAIDSIMDRVMADLGQADAIILDVRLSGGGFDNVGMSIAGHFADERRLAFTKQARDGKALTPLQEFFIEPVRDVAFTRPVYVLTSARTASAGDVFALCMRTLPHTTLVGQPSTGILSDNLKKHLPNGWMTSLSNELYCSPSGQLFEGPGVPVDIETPVFVEKDFESGYRAAVNTALELAARHTGDGPTTIIE